jgi:4,5-DOPA dioxygenase extradiol
MQPAFFLPHGAPDLALSDIPAAQFLGGILANRPAPKGIVIISAHWESSGLQITTANHLETIHDFGGFGSALHALRYPARSEPWLVNETKNALSADGIVVTNNENRGLDHGAWIPLMLMLPKAEVPIVQLSLPRQSSPQSLFEIGRALAKLAALDIMVIGSGATVHNLRHIAREGTSAPDWATAFDDWLETVLVERNWPELFQFQTLDIGRASHPTTEHFLPLIVIAGICDVQPESRMSNLHRSYSYGSIGMAAWEVQYAV